MGSAGNCEEAAPDRAAIRRGTCRLARILHFAARAVCRRTGGIAEPQPIAGDGMATIIARRAERFHNHERAGVSEYIARHMALAAGPRHE